jgi:hypothetical protein
MDLKQLFHDLDKPRTPKEMEEYFHDIYSITNQSNELTKLARLKKGRYKEFLEEFYQLYCFSKSCYCKNALRMNIVIGNQGYDAVILFNDGSEEKYEITGYIDGEWDFINAKSLNESGIGIVNVEWVESIVEKQENYLRKILDNVKNKAEKDYSDINIIFAVDTFSYFEVFDKESSLFINTLIDNIGHMEIRAKKIFLLRLKNQGLKEIDKNIFVIK